MRIDLITAVPELLDSPLNTSILKRAQNKGHVEFNVHNLRDYAHDKHRLIDDKPFGGKAGMVLKPEPFFECIRKLQNEVHYDAIIYPSPRGKIFSQQDANRLSMVNNILFVIGHYKGIDERVYEKFRGEEFSIGNFVLTGGELPALLMADAIVRVIPGVLNDSESALSDSFQDGEIIGAPCYTRPAVYEDMKVPEVLLSGNHQAVQEWKLEQSRILTNNWKKINNLE
ncbi:MAG: tRNA (guanosine(37)-N1)-methyltransferase TrmD [Ignavibacteria bacterium]|nr:tRNA (guanosine(37)-N1)-methyltransferase TrmD [Ignavibacteria bacterium]